MENNNFYYYRTKLNRCNFIYNKLGIVFILSNIFILVGNVESIVDCFNLNNPFIYLCSLIFVGTAFYFGLTGLLNRISNKNIISMCTYILFTFLSFMFPQEDKPYFFIFNILFIVSNIVFIILNKQYHELEQIEGFPYFNKRFEQEKANAKRNVYQEFADEVKSRNLGSKMDEI